MSGQTLVTKYMIASKLAKYLRIHGDKVLNGSCKMSLATSALCLLNNLFVERLNNGLQLHSEPPLSDQSIDDDIIYLYDFMKKISSLKLFHQVQTLRGGVDLTHFSKLTVLELRKIPAHLIIGLDCLAVQLKALICSRSLYLLKEIFGTSVNDLNEPLIWTELKELNLSYNYLESLDQSLRCLPNVEILDLSHNHIKNTEEIQVLKMLNFVNMSFNELNHLPVFHVASCRSLTKLYMRNNNLEDLDGLDCLFNLEELDVSFNLLSDYHVLNPLDKLKSLRMISFEGNPLYFHSQHQLLVVSYINPLVLIRGLILNGKPLSLTRSMSSNSNNQSSMERNNQHQTSINAVVEGGQRTMYIPTNLEHLSRSFADVSEKSSYEENSVSSLTSQSGAEQIAVGTKKNRRRKSKTGKKMKKTREVLINENNDQDFDVPKIENDIVAAIPSHIQAKANMEARREELGESWLIPESSFSKLMLPTPQVPANTPICTNIAAAVQSLSVNDLASKVNSSFAVQNNQSSETNNQLVASSPRVKEMKEILDISTHDSSAELEIQSANENDDIEILSSCCNGEETNLPARFTTSKEEFSDGDIYRYAFHPGGDNQNLEHIEELESEEESEDSIFFVERQDEFSNLSVSVNVGANYIKEKDVTTGKMLDKLDLNALQSVEAITKDMDGLKMCNVKLEFDTLKSSRKKRIYVFDDIKSAKALSKILQPFADAKTLKEVTLGALECLKCNSQFSKQVANKTVIKTKKPLYGKEMLSSSVESGKEYVQEVDACPNCGSHILVEMESIPLPAMGTSPRAPFFQKIKSNDKSSDSASVGSGSSGKLFSNILSSMKISPILKRKSVSNENADDAGAIGSSSCVTSDLNQSSENDLDMTRNSSDITLLSNPSQSSIAVIPDPEINLNTILERDSQSSLSPPISQDSIYYKAHIASNAEDYSDINESDTQGMIKEKDEQGLVNGKDADFYSFTESSINTSASHFATNEVTSSDSDKFRSPARTNESQKSAPESPSGTRELDEVSHILSILGGKRTFTYDTFSQIDHWLKLHLEFNIFGNDEQLEACLMTSIVPLSSGDEFSGLCAISSKKLYIIKFLPSFSKSLKQNEPLDKAVRVVHASLLNNLSQIDVFLGSQGLTIACGPTHVYSLIIRDADICNSFSSLLSEFILERESLCGKVEFLSSADITLQMIKDSIFSALESDSTSDKMPEILLHLFAFFSDSPTQEKDSFIPVCIIITPDDLFVSRILYKKCDSVPDLKNFGIFQYTSVDNQKLSDLISLKLKSDFKSVEVSFLNESSQDDSVVWNVKMETKSALFSFISALKNPWESIFGVPLSLSLDE